MFFISVDSTESENCQWELSKAFDYKKRIIPIVCREGYSYKTLQKIGLSSINYVSFLREESDFCKPLNQLLEALATNLEDVKIYNRLLNKAHEWLESERADWRLIPHQELLDIQHWLQARQVENVNDQRELQRLLPLQEEYMYASQQQYLISQQQQNLEKLALQRKRQSLYLSSVIFASLGLAFWLLTATFSEIRALVKSLDEVKELDALAIGLQTGKRITTSDFLVRFLRPDLRSKATTAIHRTALRLREINRLNEHDGEVLSVEFSPDAQQMISIGSDEALRWWKFHDTHVEQSKTHGDSIITAAYSSDGSRIAAGNESGVISLWTSDGEISKQLQPIHSGVVSQVLFSPGSQHLLSAGADGKIFLWTQKDAFEKPQMIIHSNNEPIAVVAFSPNSQYFASADFRGQVKLWSLEGELLKTFQYKGSRLPNIDESSDDTRIFTMQFSLDSAFDDIGIFTMQFSPDISLLAFAGASGVIQVEDLSNETTQWLADHDAAVYQIMFSSDGFTLASASADATVKLWKSRYTTNNWQLTHTLRGHVGAIYRFGFGPQDDVLATGGADGIVRLWLTDEGTLIDSFEGHQDIISSLAFSPKPTLGYQSVLASSSIDGDIRLWNIESPIQPLPHANRVFDVAFRPDGRVVASSGINTIRLWRREKATLRSHIEFGKSSQVYALDYSPSDGNLLVAGDSQGQIKLWQPELDTKSPKQVIQDAHLTQHGDEIPGKTTGVLDISFSPNGVWMASGGADKTLKLWRVENNQLRRYLTINTSNDITGVAFSRDSKLLAMSSRADTDVVSRGITVWDMPTAPTGQEPSQRFKTNQGHEGSVLTVAINPVNSDQIASGGADGRINLWNASGKLIRTLNEHTDPVTQVAFSEDGLFLASSSNDGTVRLWTAKGDLISVLERHDRAVSSVEFGPGAGELLASSSFDTDVLLWNLWDLSDVGMTVHNQNQKILTMLIAKGCEAAEKYLATRLQQQAHEKYRPEMSTTEQESFKELEEIYKFCSQR